MNKKFLKELLLNLVLLLSFLAIWNFYNDIETKNFSNLNKIYITVNKSNLVSVNKELYFILVSGGNASKYIFESYERILSNFGYVINGNYIGVLNEQKFYKQIYHIYNFFKNNDKKIILIGHSAGSNIILNIKLNSNYSKSIYFLLAMNNELVPNLDNVYVINGLFDEMHPLGETINITSKKYYSTLTNHIGQLSDFNTIYSILSILNTLNDFNKYYLVKNNYLKIIFIKELLIYLLTTLIFFLLISYFYIYNKNLFSFLAFLTIVLIYFLFKYLKGFYEVNFIISCLILSYIFKKLDSNLKEILINFELLIFSFILSSILSCLFILFLRNIDINLVYFDWGFFDNYFFSQLFNFIIYFINLFLGLNYSVIKATSSLLHLLFIIFFIFIIQKHNYESILNYIYSRINLIKNLVNKLNTNLIFLITILLIISINSLNLILIYINLSEIAFDLFRFFQFIFRVLLTISLFLLFKKLGLIELLLKSNNINNLNKKVI
jgi:hypothetical protein